MAFVDTSSPALYKSINLRNPAHDSQTFRFVTTTSEYAFIKHTVCCCYPQRLLVPAFAIFARRFAWTMSARETHAFDRHAYGYLLGNRIPVGHWLGSLSEGVQEAAYCITGCIGTPAEPCRLYVLHEMVVIDWPFDRTKEDTLLNPLGDILNSW